MIAIPWESDLSDFGDMLAEAMRRKAKDLGVRRYTYRDLERDSHYHFTLAQKAVKYERIPGREVIAAWSRALAPHLPLEAALIAAYLPRGERKRGLLSRARDLADQAFESASQDVPDGDAQADAEDERNR